MFMSIAIRIGEFRARLSGGAWRSPNASLQHLLNEHLASLQIPGHLPPNEREITAARSAIDAFNGEILSVRRIKDGPTHTKDGRQIVFSK